jgi:hypothetical protein
MPPKMALFIYKTADYFCGMVVAFAFPDFFIRKTGGEAWKP